MAIVDRPLYGDSAYGKIRNTVVFFSRSANLQATDPAEKTWTHFLPHLSFRQNETAARLAQKQLFLDAIIAWRALEPLAKLAWEQQAGPMQTGFNAFMEAAMSPTCPPCYFDGNLASVFQCFDLDYSATFSKEDIILHFNSILAAEVYLDVATLSVVFANITPP